jgi:hypothetical protein
MKIFMAMPKAASSLASTLPHPVGDEQNFVAEQVLQVVPQASASHEKRMKNGHLILGFGGQKIFVNAIAQRQ